MLPQATHPKRADTLWEHTCFEVFISEGEGPGYIEFNFAPSREWAMYHFTSYRRDMRAVYDIAVPRIGAPIRSDYFELFPVIYPLADTGSRIGLSAVVEETDGTKSYWALAHPPGKPDFHHAACFAATLPPPSEP